MATDIVALAAAVDAATAQLAEAANAYVAEAHKLNAAHYGSPQNPGRYPHPVYENAAAHLRMVLGAHPDLARYLGLSVSRPPRTVASLYHR